MRERERCPRPEWSGVASELAGGTSRFCPYSCSLSEYDHVVLLPMPRHDLLWRHGTHCHGCSPIVLCSHRHTICVMAFVLTPSSRGTSWHQWGNKMTPSGYNGTAHDPFEVMGLGSGWRSLAPGRVTHAQSRCLHMPS
jgi:hypothetical protein